MYRDTPHTMLMIVVSIGILTRIQTAGLEGESADREMKDAVGGGTEIHP
jgi:hypothetical protein